MSFFVLSLLLFRLYIKKKIKITSHFFRWRNQEGLYPFPKRNSERFTVSSDKSYWDNLTGFHMATQCIRLKNPAIPWCFSTGGPSVVEVFIYFFVHSNCFLPHHSALPEMRSIQQFFISDKLFLKSCHSSRPTGRDLLYLYDIKTL